MGWILVMFINLLISTQPYVISRPKVEKSLLGDNCQSDGWQKFEPRFGIANHLTINSTASGISPAGRMTCLSNYRYPIFTAAIWALMQSSAALKVCSWVIAVSVWFKQSRISWPK